MTRSRRPTIGVTTQTLQAIDGIPAGLPASVVMNQRYYEAVASAGGAPLLIPLLDDDDALRAAYEACGGIPAGWLAGLRGRPFVEELLQRRSVTGGG